MRSQAMFFQRRAGDALADPQLQKNFTGLRTSSSACARRVVAAREGFRRAARCRPGDPRSRPRRSRRLARTVRGKGHAAWRHRALGEGWPRICEHVVAIARKHGVKRSSSRSRCSPRKRNSTSRSPRRASSRWKPTSANTSCRSPTTSPRRTSWRRPPTRTSTRSPTSCRQARQTAQDRDPALTREAREVLREHFLSADMGISGGNFLIAESGSVALVTNEGNGRMVTTLPKVHVVITGIEKIVPNLDGLRDADAAAAALRDRAGNLQYVSVCTGTRGRGGQRWPRPPVSSSSTTARRLVGSGNSSRCSAASAAAPA